MMFPVSWRCEGTGLETNSYRLHGFNFLSTQEQTKAVPVLSSSLYGHRPPLEPPSRRHVRVATVKRDFYRHSGTNIPLF